MTDKELVKAVEDAALALAKALNAAAEAGLEGRVALMPLGTFSVFKAKPQFLEVEIERVTRTKIA